MTIAEFVAKWRKVELTERSASQQHFLDLCAVFAHPTPAGADAAGEWFSSSAARPSEGGRVWGARGQSMSSAASSAKMRASQVSTMEDIVDDELDLPENLPGNVR